MLIDARQLPENERLTADVCIVGAGAAGITLASELRGSGLSVILLEAGGEGDGRHMDPFEGEVVNLDRHPALTLYRSRRFGGATGMWGGRCLPLDSIDFEARPYVPFSGWPVTREALNPFYARAMRYCEAGAATFRVAEALPRARATIPGFHDRMIITDTIERFSKPTDFGKRYRADLAADPDIKVVLPATCTAVALDSFGTVVDHLKVASSPDRRFTVQARRYVIAAGGLENTRLLLASDDVLRTGIGNQAGLLGRFYMCHLEGKAGVIALRPQVRNVVSEYERDAEGIYCRRRLWIADSEQRRQGLLNFAARFESPVIADPAHRNSILSAMFVTRTFLKKEYARRIATFGYRGTGDAGTVSQWLGHVRNIVLHAPSLAVFAARWISRHNLADRKLPFVPPQSRGSHIHLDYNAEQSPNPDSRVTLCGLRDEYGMPRLRVDWRACELDIGSVVRAFRLLRHRLERAGVGTVAFDEDAIRRDYTAIGGHHMGTTRMASDSRRGVVDADCRVFGVDNLFIAGGSIFATSGNANPTLTIVALALRLADHLKTLAAPQPVVVHPEPVPASQPFDAPAPPPEG